MKLLVTATLLLAFYSTMAQDIGQSTLATAGQSQTQGEHSLDWTVGQNVSTAQTNGTTSLISGVHQPTVITETLVILKADNPDIRIFPNPVMELLKVETSAVSDVTLTLADLNGRELISANNKKTLDLTDLANGVYVLSIRYKNYSSQHKIIKQ